jgi:hypothetical protein
MPVDYNLLKGANDNKNLDLGFPGESDINKSWDDMVKRGNRPSLSLVPKPEKTGLIHPSFPTMGEAQPAHMGSQSTTPIKGNP